MDHWVKLVRETAEIANELNRINPIMYEPMDIHMLIKYVDDCLTALKTMKLAQGGLKVIEPSSGLSRQKKKTEVLGNPLKM